MGYKYETHLHTRQASACGRSSGEVYPQYYRDLGYSGIFVTDHFFNGNSCIPPMDCWKDRIDAYCGGYELAKEAGDAIGFPVFFGIEANFDGDEMLLYGLDKEWLYEHSDILSYSRTRLYKEVRAAGGLVVQAHPFRERGYLDKIHLNPETCDAMEGFNAGNLRSQNLNAEMYCREKGIFMTAGSDLHLAGSLKKEEHFGMEFETPLTDGKDYVERILNHEGRMVVPNKERLDFQPKSFEKKIQTGLEVVIHKAE